MNRVSLRGALRTGLRTQPTSAQTAGGLRGALRTGLRVPAALLVALALTLGTLALAPTASAAPAHNVTHVSAKKVVKTKHVKKAKRAKAKKCAKGKVRKHGKCVKKHTQKQPTSGTVSGSGATGGTSAPSVTFRAPTVTYSRTSCTGSNGTYKVTYHWTATDGVYAYVGGSETRPGDTIKPVMITSTSTTKDFAYTVTYHGSAPTSDDARYFNVIAPVDRANDVMSYQSISGTQPGVTVNCPN